MVTIVIVLHLGGRINRQFVVILAKEAGEKNKQKIYYYPLHLVSYLYYPLYFGPKIILPLYIKPAQCYNLGYV
jgi:hypothetical protein